MHNKSFTSDSSCYVIPNGKEVLHAQDILKEMAIK